MQGLVSGRGLSHPVANLKLPKSRGPPTLIEPSQDRQSLISIVFVSLLARGVLRPKTTYGYSRQSRSMLKTLFRLLSSTAMVRKAGKKQGIRLVVTGIVHSSRERLRMWKHIEAECENLQNFCQRLKQSVKSGMTLPPNMRERST